jgi:hypothetical protein
LKPPFVVVLPLLLAYSGCAWKQTITGLVIDRNGEPVPQANVTLLPGDIELVTDTNGRFAIDYVRDNSESRRTPLSAQQAYSVEVFKVGFHIHTEDFYFSRGTYVVAPIELIEETIAVRDDGDLDAGLFTQPTHSSGATYEGQ